MRQLIFILLLLPFLSYSQSEGGFGFRRFANKTNLDATSVNNSDKSASRRAYVHSTGLYYFWDGSKWVEEFGYNRYFSVKTNMPFNSNDPYLAFVDLQNYYSGRVGVIRVDTTVLIPDDVTVNTSIEFIGEGNLDVSSSKEIVFNSYIIAEPEQYIFTGDGDYTFNQRIEQLYPTWFGANELNADNYAQFQKTIDAAITSDILQVKVPGGAYTLSQGLLIRNGSDIVTLNFSGNSNYDGDAGTTLIFTDTTTFGIAIQGARNVHISNLYIRGKQNSFNPTLAQLITIPESTYDNNLGRNSRYSPYSGIVIDPFRNGTPADGGYPGFTSQYSNTHATSSNIKISDVVIRYFIGGITTSPSGFEGNGAEISIEDCVIDRNMFGICTGSSQNRDVQITGTSLSFCKYGMTGLKFGAQNGAMPIFSNGQISYAKAMLEYNATIGNGKIANTYSESLWSIGRWVGRGAPLSFTNTEIKFALDTETGVADAPCVLTSRETPFVMEGGSLFYTNYRPVNMVALSVLLKGTFINRPILNLMSNSSNEDAVEYRAVRLNGYNNSLSDYRVNQDVDAVDYSNTRNVVVLKNGKITYRESNGTTSLYSTHPENVVVYTQATQNKQATITLETKTVTIDTTLRTGTFTTSFPGKYRVGDILGFATNTRTPDGGLTFSDIGIVSSIVGGTVTTSHVPMGVTTGSIQLELYELPRFTGTWRGNIQSGTNKLIVTSKPLTTGGDSAAVRWPVGMRVYSKQATRTSTGIPRGTYVTSVLKDTIYLSNTTDTTYNEIEFFNADLKGTYYSTDGTYPTSADTLRSVSFQRGDEIYFIGHAYRRKATVTLGGFTPTLSFIYKTLYGLDANKPTPTSADIGLTYFSTDSSKLKIWTGTTWIGVGGGSSVNIGNSDLTTDDNLRTLTLQDDFQIIGDGVSPSTYIEMGSLAGGRALITNSQSSLYYSDLGGVNQFFANTNGIQITTPLTSSRSILLQADSIIEQGAVNGELYKFYPDPTYIYPSEQFTIDGTNSAGDFEITWGQVSSGRGIMTIGQSNGDINVYSENSTDGLTGINISSISNPATTLLSTPTGEGSNSFSVGGSNIILDTEAGDEFSIGAPINVVNIITPPNITASVNDYNPTNLDDAFELLLTSTANVNITGIEDQQDGRLLIVTNNGTFNITLVNASGLSSANNRFDLYSNIVINPKTSVYLRYYAGSINKWKAVSYSVVAQPDGNGIYGGDGNIPAGGSQVLMDTIGETVRFVMNTGNTTLREMLRLETVENAFTRFFVLKGPSDSLRVFRASAGRQYTFQTYGGTAFQIASDSIISFLADSVLYVEGSVESKSKMRYLLGLTVNNYVKRFDGNAANSGDIIISDATDWKVGSLSANEFNVPHTIRVTLSAKQDNWNPTGFSTTKSQTIRIKADASFRFITGLESATRDGVQKTFINDSTNCFGFAKQHTDSDADNRFNINRDVIMYPGTSATFQYDSVGQKWKLISTSKNEVNYSAYYDIKSSTIGAIIPDNHHYDGIVNGGAISRSSAGNIADSRITSTLFSTSTAPGGIACAVTYAGEARFNSNEYYLRAFTRVRFEDLSTATEDFDFIFGYGEYSGADTTADNKRGVYITYKREENSGGFVLNSHDGTTKTQVNAGSAIAADTWYELEVIYYPFGEAVCFIDGVRYSKTNNIPTSGAASIIIMNEKDNGSTARIVYMTSLDDHIVAVKE